ncbi:DUF4392 domain-containing protein [Bermanella marisrubri]|uniref:D-glutamate cyclase-like C-terminal domain-containing protein n=1 Tax=Bermanella marisrubri TaxID=207949 RepID=Q1N2K3_9GAMM|nr:DUF4392 domain-containing protein [Bermanella marisrubri]EAT12404.1 hypothetical protein RED65_16241 [Oceanobacter sp. RED65] [Bermanella marisrubri]QIZ85485.1 DUF4392 domain-containing protein [Bermanella marisrubri]
MNEALMFDISKQIEDILVERNLRGMKTVQHALPSGYIKRASDLILGAKGTVLIGTGFPVVDTFETDGPVGAIALYRAFEAMGLHPIIVCGAPLSEVLRHDYNVQELIVGPHCKQDDEARQALQDLNPSLIVSIERPGQASDGRYYNMRGEDISARAGCFDSFFRQANCPTIAIGDGGNEIGMGNIHEALNQLDIQAAATQCSELVIADVSNWAALGLIAMISAQMQRDLLTMLDARQVLEYLSDRGSVDGVTRENTLTEDGLPVEDGLELQRRLRVLIEPALLGKARGHDAHS